MTIDKLSIRPEAERDIKDAARWYESKQSGLGERFLTELDTVLARIALMPQQYPVLEEDMRRALLRRFPYSVYFVETDIAIIIFAVLHQHRHPDTWRIRR